MFGRTAFWCLKYWPLAKTRTATLMSRTGNTKRNWKRSLSEYISSQTSLLRQMKHHSQEIQQDKAKGWMGLEMQEPTTCERVQPWHLPPPQRWQGQFQSSFRGRLQSRNFFASLWIVFLKVTKTCWDIEPRDRPTFHTIVRELESMRSYYDEA